MLQTCSPEDKAMMTSMRKTRRKVLILRAMANLLPLSRSSTNEQYGFSEGGWERRIGFYIISKLVSGMGNVA